MSPFLLLFFLCTKMLSWLLAKQNFQAHFQAARELSSCLFFSVPSSNSNRAFLFFKHKHLRTHVALSFDEEQFSVFRCRRATDKGVGILHLPFLSSPWKGLREAFLPSFSPHSLVDMRRGVFSSPQESEFPFPIQIESPSGSVHALLS